MRITWSRRHFNWQPPSFTIIQMTTQKATWNGVDFYNTKEEDSAAVGAVDYSPSFNYAKHVSSSLLSSLEPQCRLWRRRHVTLMERFSLSSQQVQEVEEEAAVYKSTSTDTRSTRRVSTLANKKQFIDGSRVGQSKFSVWRSVRLSVRLLAAVHGSRRLGRRPSKPSLYYAIESIISPCLLLVLFIPTGRRRVCSRWSGRGFLIDQKNCFYRRLLHWHWSRLLLPSSNLNSCVSICLHTHWMSEWMQQWLETWLVYIIVCLSRRRRRRSGGDWWIWLEMGWRQLSRVCVCVIVGMHGTTWWHSTQYANTNIANCGSLERWFGVVSLLPGNEDRQLIF